MKTQASIDSIIILESLSKKEKKTGRILYDSLSNIKINIPVTFKEVANANTFKITLNELLMSSEYKKPLLHIESHAEVSPQTASEDLVMTFSDKSTLFLSSIADLLTEINIKSQFNLFISFAMCFGAHALNISPWLYKQNKALPFFALTGPTKEVLPDHLLDSYTNFYTLLIRSQSFNEAKRIISDNGFDFFCYDVQSMICDTIRRYIVTESSGRKREARAISSQKELIGKSHFFFSIDQIKEKTTLDETLERYINNDMLPTLLAFDRVPSNKERFKHLAFLNLLPELFPLIESDSCDISN